MVDLEKELALLKEYATNREIKRLNKRIYNLRLDNKFLESLPQGTLQYIHVKLHNALSYNKPFASLKQIKEAHNRLARLLKNHSKIDKLDD